jgi:uncharacterized membrane protein YkvA (DUF1232 family)
MATSDQTADAPRSAASDTKTGRQRGMLDGIGVGYVLETLGRLPEFFTSPSIKRPAKVIVGVLLAYLISPVDLLPEIWLPGLGLIDDFAVAIWMLRFINQKTAGPTEAEAAGAGAAKPGAGAAADDDVINVDARPVD